MTIDSLLLNTSFALFCGYGMHVFMTRYMPFIYNLFLYSCFYNAVLCYSKLEIYGKKTWNLLMNNPYVYDFIHRHVSLENKVQMVKANYYVSSHNLDDLIQQYQASPFDYEFIMISYHNNTLSNNDIFKLNRAILYKLPSNYVSIDYESCDYRFMSIFITVNEEKYQLLLSTDCDNYYVSGNVLNAKFFRFLLKHQHNINTDKNKIKYTLDLIDHNVNIVSLNELDDIVLGKNNYDIDHRIASEEDTSDDEEEGEEGEEGEGEEGDEYADMPPLIDMDADETIPFVFSTETKTTDTVSETNIFPFGNISSSILSDAFMSNISDNIIFTPTTTNTKNLSLQNPSIIDTYIQNPSSVGASRSASEGEGLNSVTSVKEFVYGVPDRPKSHSIDQQEYVTVEK